MATQAYLPASAYLDKNKLNQSGAYLVLLEITVPDGTVFRVCSNTEDIVWRGYTWQAFSFNFKDLSENSKGEIPRVQLQVWNGTKALEPYLDEGDGGIGSTVEIFVVHSGHLDEEDSLIQPAVFEAATCDSTHEWVTFGLSAPSLYTRRFPRNRIIKNYCRWRFKSGECGYTGTATTCAKTIQACRALENSARFGGFPGTGTGGFYASDV